MDVLRGTVTIANSNYATKIENLRHESYLNSENIDIADTNEFNNYCKWSKKDEQGLVLIAKTNLDEVVAGLRGNVYYSEEQLESNNPNFVNNSNGFVDYPVLDITSAATSPKYFRNDLLSVLSYYMLFLHKHSVKSINGSAVKGSSVFRMFEKFDFEVKEIFTQRTDLIPHDKWTIANLKIDNIEIGLNYLRLKHCNSIERFPLVISLEDT